MSVNAINSSNVAVALLAQQTAAKSVDRPNDGDGDDGAAKASPAPGTGKLVDVSA